MAQYCYNAALEHNIDQHHNKDYNNFQQVELRKGLNKILNQVVAHKMPAAVDIVAAELDKAVVDIDKAAVKAAQHMAVVQDNNWEASWLY
jgi:hypothetical protein